MSPTAHLEPGVVQAYGTQGTGVIDLGRYPEGLDALCEEIAPALGGSRFSSVARPDIMRFKYAKLLSNLGNAVDASAAGSAPTQKLPERAQRGGPGGAERRRASSSSPTTSTRSQARWQQLDVQPIAGRERAGSSTWQSLARGMPTVETDYLNGEIALLGRLHGVPTPVNELCASCRPVTCASGRAPQTLPAGEVLALARSGAVRAMDQFVADAAAEIAARANRELEALVGRLLALGRRRGAEEAIALCAAFLPPQAEIERVPCSTPGSAPDMVARIAGQGIGPAAAARPRRHGHRARLARAAAARRRPPLRPRHGRHEGRRRARARGRPRAGRAPRAVRGARRAARHRRGVAPARRSATSSGSPATTPACASRAAS